MRTAAAFSSIREALLGPVPQRQTVDARVYLAINQLPHGSESDAYITLLSDLGKGAGWVAGSIWLTLRDGSRGRRAGLAATTAMFATILLVQGPAKAVFRRRRPFAGRLAIVVGPRPVDSSFPSGHTAGSFAAATALASFYPRDRSLLLFTASAVGVSRVYLGHHFPSDVVVGAGMGMVLGSLAARLARLGSGQPVNPLSRGEASALGTADHGDRAGSGGTPAGAVPDRG
jgi:undecaprenyl-diphosphatase